MKRLLSGIALLLLFMAPAAHAFDLTQLSEQLSQPAVVRGDFVQEKHLRALPQPLVSRGHFVLAQEYGLLWLLREPLQQDYRIDARGIARRQAAGWQQQPQRGAAAQQNRLFLAVLRGDTSGLQEDFELALSGSAEAWQLDLTPRSQLLKQIFNSIRISGGALVQRIALDEAQGDRTILQLSNNMPDNALNPAERGDFAQ